ncbi:MAG: hypothetical protein JNK10_09190 [Cyclobacteriaceae bacterium]|nr:hypothetical protein [Cyclobacteriaceae bacterium]
MKSRLLLFLLLLLPAGLRAAAPDTARVGAFVISVHDINFHDKEYTVRFWLWFLYKNPEFDFTSQLDIPNAKTIEPPESIIDTVDGKAWVMLKMKCTMKENWSVQDFPFDTQHLRVQIENSILDNTVLIFDPDLKGSKFDDEEAIDGWTIRNFTVGVRDNHYDTGFGDPREGRHQQTFSQFTIDMDIERNAWGLFMKIFLGMYIAFLIAIISFTPHPSEMEPRFGLPVGGLFAAVGNKYIIDSLLPESSQFSLVDTLHALTFIAIFGTLLVSAIALKQYDNGRKELSELTNRRGARIVVTIYVVLNIIFIALAVV